MILLITLLLELSLDNATSKLFVFELPVFYSESAREARVVNGACFSVFFFSFYMLTGPPLLSWRKASTNVRKVALPERG